jgi:hypothetical protein
MKEQQCGDMENKQRSTETEIKDITMWLMPPKTASGF